MGYWHDGGWGWGWVWMIVVMAIVWIPLLLVFLWFARSVIGGGDARRTSTEPPAARSEADLDAREIARRAYARGDLDRDRFLQIMEDLGGPTGGPAGGAASGGGAGPASA